MNKLFIDSIEFNWALDNCRINTIHKCYKDKHSRSDRYIQYCINNHSMEKTKVKNIIECMYEKSCSYLDKNFSTEFKSNTIERWHELLTSNILLDNWYDIQCKNRNNNWPDFCILKPNGSKIFIECVVANRWDWQNKITRFPWSWKIYDVYWPRTLRVLNSISNKINKYRKYIKDGIINQNDEYYISLWLNFCDISDILIQLAIYWKWIDGYKINKNRKLSWPYYEPKLQIPKSHNNINIDTGIFLNQENYFINGIIYLNKNIFDAISSYNEKPNILFFKNPYNNDWTLVLNWSSNYNYNINSWEITITI